MLRAENVYKTFLPPSSLGEELIGLFKPKPKSGVRAVRGLSLELAQGEILGLVGESGSGKSTLGRLLCGLSSPEQGRILFRGEDLSTFSRPKRKEFCREVQFMFQDPASSLNPRFTAEAALSEGLIIHGLGNKAYRRERVAQMLSEVGLDPASSKRYPHQFSGGQRQRLSLARALSLDPKVLVADEPASALDVSVQAQIINLLLSLKKSRDLSIIIISHDLALISLLADRVAVMYGGLAMEYIPQDALGRRNHHPYVKALWASAEHSAPHSQNLILEGEPPDPQNPPAGCPFHPRCPEVAPECSKEQPKLVELEPLRYCACLRR
jgi:oligopeptide/dipeptide ABC transporter ATP-binding protein